VSVPLTLFDERDNKFSVTHAHKACYITYRDTFVLESGKTFSATITFIEYDEAIKLAEQKKLRFSRLELTAQKR